MTKKILLKLILCLLCFILSVCVVVLSINLKVNDKLDLITTYIAKYDIAPRTCITEEDIQMITIPKSNLTDHVVHTKQEIVGKYTDIQGKIPAGSLFYESMLYDPSELPDLPSTLLKEGQAIFTLQIDSAILSTVVSSQRVDLIATIEEQGIKDVVIEHCRILQIEDINGMDVNQQDSIGIPYYVLLAVDENDILMLEKIKEIATLTLVVSNETYQETEGIKKENSEIITYLNSQ